MLMSNVSTMGCLKYSVMAVFLVPEVDLVELLHVQSLVCEGGHVQVAPGWEHLTAWFQEFFSVKKGLEHSLI